MRSLIRAFASRLNILVIVKLLTENHLEFLSSKGGCTGSSESTLVTMPHCWKSHVAAHILLSSDLGSSDKGAIISPISDLGPTTIVTLIAWLINVYDFVPIHFVFFCSL